MVEANQEVLKLNGTHRLLVYTGDVRLSCEIIYSTKTNPEILLASNMKTGPDNDHVSRPACCTESQYKDR
jgi:hypothetical protein